MATQLKTVSGVIEEMDARRAGLAKLREPFPDDAVSKLPKETKAQIDARKKENGRSVMVFNCQECGGHHHKDAVHLDYVGHAALTDRLLDADPVVVVGSRSRSMRKACRRSTATAASGSRSRSAASRGWATATRRARPAATA
jgi:hypothetical protein